MSISLSAQKAETEVLLIGTFHFNNPGLDVVKLKTISVMTEKSQNELEQMANKINKYNPSKIFVEWEYNKQAELDTLFNLYLQGKYFDYIAKKYPKRKFYSEGEIFQLAFRVAKKVGLTQVYAIDNQDAGDFPYDSLMAEIGKAGQFELKKEIELSLTEYQKKENFKMATKSLTEIILDDNLQKNRIADLGDYISQYNRGGAKDNFVGAYLNSEWYKRNLYMYASLQKNIDKKDKKVMVLLGSSHVAMFKTFLDLDSQLKAVELKSILK